MMRRLLLLSRIACGLLVFALGLAGCDGCSAPGVGSEEQEAQVVAIGALDTLGDFDGTVSVGGVVVEEDGRTVVLQDASGLVQVRLPDDVPSLYGARLLVQGTLRESDDELRIDAYEWLYDSTHTEP